MKGTTMRTQQVPQRPTWVSAHTIEAALMAVAMTALIAAAALYIFRPLPAIAPTTTTAPAAWEMTSLGFNPGAGTVYDGQPHPRIMPVVQGLGFYPGAGTVYDGQPHPRIMPVVQGLGFYPGAGTVYDGQPHPLITPVVPGLDFYPGAGSVYNG
jgi:hypothetical protein